MDNQGHTSYYFGDHLGSTNVVTDAAGTIKERIEYDPYGSFTRHDFGSAAGGTSPAYGGTSNPSEAAHHYFTSQRFDAETGLYFYNARYYDPKLRRFLTPDSLVPYPDAPQSFNRYSYVHNNPVNYTDPTGHFAWLIPLIIGIIKGALIGAAIGAAVAAATGEIRGSFRTIISVQGSYKGQNGFFEWIKTQDNTIIHRFFKQD